MNEIPSSIVNAICGTDVIYILRGWPGLGRVMQGVSLSQMVNGIFPKQNQYFYSSDSGYNYLKEHNYDVTDISTRSLRGPILGSLSNRQIVTLIENISKSPPSAIIIDGELQLIPVIRSIYKGKIVALANKFDLFNPYHSVGLMSIFRSYYSYCDHIIVGSLDPREDKCSLPSEYPSLTWLTPFVRSRIQNVDEISANKGNYDITVVFGGGSNGAEALNSVNKKLFDSILNISKKNPDRRFSLFGITKYDYSCQIHKNIEFGLFEDCSDAIIKARLIIARAGRNTISEILVLNKAAILVPSTAGNKDRDNYRFLEQAYNADFAAKFSKNIHIWDGTDLAALNRSILRLSDSEHVNNNWHPGNVEFIKKLTYENK